MQKLLTFLFSKNISICAIFNGQSFNDMLTNDIVSFETLDPSGRVVSTPNFGSQGPGFISCWRQNSNVCMACIAQPFIITLPSSPYELNGPCLAKTCLWAYADS